MKSFIGPIILCAGVAWTALAQTPAASESQANPKTITDAALRYECKQAGEERSVEVLSDQPSAKTPCRVEYKKGSNAPETLWSAQNEYSYCEEKAATFITKLEGMGWTCSGK